MVSQSYLLAFKATTLETRANIIDWLRSRDAVHVLADVWFLNEAQTNAGNISHSIEGYDPFGAQLMVLSLNSDPTDYSGTKVSDEVSSWMKQNLQP